MYDVGMKTKTQIERQGARVHVTFENLEVVKHGYGYAVIVKTRKGTHNIYLGLNPAGYDFSTLKSNRVASSENGSCRLTDCELQTVSRMIELAEME